MDDCFSIEVYVQLPTDKARVQATAGTSKNLVLNLGVLQVGVWGYLGCFTAKLLLWEGTDL